MFRDLGHVVPVIEAVGARILVLGGADVDRYLP
jgi:hypothetical protein